MERSDVAPECAQANMQHANVHRIASCLATYAMARLGDAGPIECSAPVQAFIQAGRSHLDHGWDEWSWSLRCAVPARQRSPHCEHFEYHCGLP